MRAHAAGLPSAIQPSQIPISPPNFAAPSAVRGPKTKPRNQPMFAAPQNTTSARATQNTPLLILPIHRPSPYPTRDESLSSVGPSGTPFSPALIGSLSYSWRVLFSEERLMQVFIHSIVVISKGSALAHVKRLSPEKTDEIA